MLPSQERVQSSTALEEAISKIFPHPRIIEFQTFTREGMGLLAHAHVFEPVHRFIKSNAVVESGLAKINPIIINEVTSEREPINREPSTPSVKCITIQLQPAFETYPLIPIRAEHRSLFPGFREPFIIETDEGHFETHVAGAKDAVKGDPTKGSYLRTGIPKWQRNHPGLHGGSNVQIEIIEPMHQYKLRA